MKISIDNALGAHAQALALRSTRSQMLAENIANADTPGYQARDIDFGSVLASRLENRSSGLVSTNVQHISGISKTVNDQISIRTPLLSSVDKNGVNVQQEQATFAENSIQLQAALNFVDGRFRSMINALKGE